MTKDEIRQEAWKSWEETNKHHREGINPHAYELGYIVGRSVSEEENAKLRKLLIECRDTFPDRFPGIKQRINEALKQ